MENEYNTSVKEDFNRCADLPLDKIKAQLLIKKVKGKEYYYIRERIQLAKGKYKAKKTVDVYVSPVKADAKKLKFNFCLAKTKAGLEVFLLLRKLSRKGISYDYLQDELVELLEMLRFAYAFFLKQYSESDLKKYEEAVYTKYVYGTTSIEGNTYTLRETDITLNEGLTVSGKEKREFYEVENYSRLKKHLDNIKDIVVDKAFIKTIHGFILANIDQESAGEFRRIDVGIRGTTFEPPPAIVVEDEVDALLSWYSDHETKMHPIELVSIFHQKFEEIHPFRDGNGRVGRELLRIMLHNAGFPSIFIDKSNRERYLKGLDKGNKKEYKSICDFIAENILEVHKTLIKKAKEDLKQKATALSTCKECINNKKCRDLAKKFSEKNFKNKAK